MDTYRCEDCGGHFQTDPAGAIQAGPCPHCGSPRPFRTQPSPVRPEMPEGGTLRNMVDSDTQIDQGGNPLGEGTIMGRDGEKSWEKRDNYMHGSVIAVLAEALPPGEPLRLHDMYGQPNRDIGVGADNNLARTCPQCYGYGCPQCNYKGEQSAPLRGKPGEGYEEPHNIMDTLEAEEGFIPVHGEAPPGAHLYAPPHRYQGKTADAKEDILGLGQAEPTRSPFLRWEPGMQGRGVLIDNEPHTWVAFNPSHVTGDSNHLGLMHRDYVRSIGIDPARADYGTGLEILPDGELRHGKRVDPAPFLQADPRLKPPSRNNDPLVNFRLVGHSPESRTSDTDMYASWEHEADAINFDKGPLAAPPHSAIVQPGAAGIHGSHYDLLHFLDAHLDGQSVRQMGPNAMALTYGDPTRKQAVQVSAHHPDHLPALQEQLEHGGFEPTPLMGELISRMEKGEVQPPPGVELNAPPPAPEQAMEAVGNTHTAAAALLEPATMMMGRLGLAHAAGGLMHKVLGIGGGEEPQQQEQQLQPNLMLSAVLMADYETPASNPEVGVIENDPQKVDQKEFNDQDKSPENLLNPNLDDSGATGEDAVRDHAGFGHDSPGIERMHMNLPLLLHYVNSPHSGADDPMVRSLHETLEAENPGYLDRVTPEEHALADQFIQQQAQKPHGVHASEKTAILGGDPNAVNQMMHQMAEPNGPTGMLPPGGAQTPGHCPGCGGTLDPNGQCPQCGYGGQQMGAPQMHNQALPAAMPQGFSHFDIVAALFDSANHQGPTTPEQISAVQQFLIDQGRAEETPMVPVKPADYAQEMAEIQQNPNVAPQVTPAEQTQPPPPQMGAPGAMPMPGMGAGEPGGQPMQPMANRQAADSIARRCPRCKSATTGILNEDGDSFCHACANIWKEDKLVEDTNKSSRVAAPVNPVALPAADRHEPLNPEAQQDSSLSWRDEMGKPLVPGQEYEMINPAYELPDVVKVETVKPDGIAIYLVGMFGNDPESLQAKKNLTHEDVMSQHITFRPLAENIDGRNNQPPPGTQTPGEVPPVRATDEEDLPQSAAMSSVSSDHCPQCGYRVIESSMSSPTTMMHECFRCSHAWETKESYEGNEGGSELAYLFEDNSDDFNAGYERVQQMQSHAQKSRDIRTIAAKDSHYQEIKDYLDAQRNERVAGRHFTPAEQRELVDEDGIARNRHMLDLANTHYKSSFEEGKLNPDNAPDSHLIFGL